MIETERLILRNWRDEDREPFAAMGQDARVMEHFPALLSREETDRMVDRVNAHVAERGFGLWAVEEKATGAFIGFTGLWVPWIQTHFTPCVEVGWRLAAEYWGKGYASEGARGSLSYGFNKLGLKEIVAFTTPGNAKSRAVMERLGMTRNPDDDFDHPAIPEPHDRRMVLYRLSAGAFRAK